MSAVTSAEPPASVITAFGGDPVALQPLAGGEGRSFRAGAIVLKPATEEATLRWSAGLLNVITASTTAPVRVAPPIEVAGEFLLEGWSAAPWLEGGHVPGSWDRVLETSLVFHDAVAAAAPEWPDHLARRQDPWSTGDRVAWGEETLGDATSDAIVTAAASSLEAWTGRPVAAPAQVIHGDLVGNVLFADDPSTPPAVIDFSPLRRPRAFADAIIVADAVAWDGAPLTLAVRFLAATADGDALLARAIVFRIVAAARLWPQHPERVAAEVDGYRPLHALLS